MDECLERDALGAVERLLFGLQLGSLIPLIPPFYCQLFPSYRQSRTEFRICATVHHSNLRPTDAALLFLSLHQYRCRHAHQRPPSSGSTIGPTCPTAAFTQYLRRYSFLHLFPSPLHCLAGRQVRLENVLHGVRTTGA